VSGLEVGGIAAGVGGVGAAVAAGVATAEDTKAQADELGGKAGTQDSDKVEE
jgi:hypothetical protein